MDLVVFENNKPFVIDEFREGRFDYVELACDAARERFVRGRRHWPGSARNVQSPRPSPAAFARRRCLHGSPA